MQRYRLVFGVRIENSLKLVVDFHFKKCANFADAVIVTDTDEDQPIVLVAKFSIKVKKSPKTREIFLFSG